MDLDDVITSLKYCLQNESTKSSTFDIGGPDIVSYKEMLELTAKALGKKRLILHFPFLIPQLSKFWVTEVASTPSHLVYPLIESMRHKMVCDPEKQLIIDGMQYTGCDESIKKSVTNGEASFVRSIINYNRNLNLSFLKIVTSMQRLENPKNQTAEELADIYFKWLPNYMRPFIKVVKSGKMVEFRLLGVAILKLSRSSERSDSHRVLFYIEGGVLARKQTLRGRLEFRRIESTKVCLVALLDFRPSLPWFVYNASQALVHLLVMHSFQQYLSNIDAAKEA